MRPAFTTNVSALSAGLRDQASELFAQRFASDTQTVADVLLRKSRAPIDSYDGPFDGGGSGFAGQTSRLTKKALEDMNFALTHVYSEEGDLVGVALSRLVPATKRPALQACRQLVLLAVSKNQERKGYGSLVYHSVGRIGGERTPVLVLAASGGKFATFWSRAELGLAQLVGGDADVFNKFFNPFPAPAVGIKLFWGFAALGDEMLTEAAAAVPQPKAKPQSAGKKRAGSSEAVLEQPASSRARAAETAAGSSGAKPFLVPVGSRLRVWWEVEQAWYPGTVMSYTSASQEVDADTHEVVYDDGDVQQEALSSQSLRWELLAQEPADEVSTQATPILLYPRGAHIALTLTPVVNLISRRASSCSCSGLPLSWRTRSSKGGVGIPRHLLSSKALLASRR